MGKSGIPTNFMVNIKEYVISCKVRNLFVKRGLLDIIINRQGSLVPDTKRAKKRQAIDFIWGSQGIFMTQG